MFIKWYTNKNSELELVKFSNLPVDSEKSWKSYSVPFWFTSLITCYIFYWLIYCSSCWMKPNSNIYDDQISFIRLYLTGDGVGARTCLTGEGECLIGDGDCCRANCALAVMDGGVGDLDFGLGGILGGVLCGSCCPAAPSMTISTVAIDLASKWASIFCKK